MAAKTALLIRNAAPQDFGGGERFPVFLAEELEKQDYKPIILSRSQKLLTFATERGQKTIKSWWWRKQQWSGVNNLLLPAYFVWQAVLYFYYKRLFRSLQPAVVHVQSKDDFISATHAATKLGICVIWTDHADLKHIWQNVQKPYKNTIGKSVLRAAEKAAVITVVSKSEEKLVTDNLPEESPIRQKITVVYNGVLDTASKYQKLSASNVFTFLVASRLVTDKGIREVIEAFKRLHEKHPSAQLVLIGDGPEAQKFHEEAKDTPAIILKGHQPDPLSFMAKADVFVHPTYHEGFSVALVEASMMSLPIIATNVGGNPEIIHNNETGLLVKIKDTESLFNAMDKIYEDNALRDRLGKAARRQYQDKFQFDRIVKDEFIPLYKGKKV